MVPVLIALLALGYAVTSATCLPGRCNTADSSAGYSGSSSSASSSLNIAVALGQHVVAPLLLAAGLLVLIRRHGRVLVDRPQLCPHLAHTVAAAESSAAQQH
eukprot:GHRQ01017534.1.p3 GENE.GHRQ01017534.1~~GHRQ01017534.1.p3  ORF type:complete len:102 (+),score=53.01 GHRQ01017534.1:1524-1829(+)